MQHRFQKHYTREEAKALLPEVQQWLAQLLDLRDRAKRFEIRLN